MTWHFSYKNGIITRIKRKVANITDSWEQRELNTFVDKAVDNRGKTPPTSPEGPPPLSEVAALGCGSQNYSKV